MGEMQVDVGKEDDGFGHCHGDGGGDECAGIGTDRDSQFWK